MLEAKKKIKERLSNPQNLRKPTKSGSKIASETLPMGMKLCGGWNQTASRPERNTAVPGGIKQ